MSKNVKKKSRRIWRRVRKTLGTLFLVSALVIAAIPVDSVRADDDSTDSDEGTTQAGYASENTTYTCATKDMIPQMDEKTKIYTTAGEEIQFAYLNDGSGYGAVIVGYNGGYLENGTLDFTKPVDAYGQYRINDGGGGYNFVAVGLNGNFLFYEEQVTTTYTGTVQNEVEVSKIQDAKVTDANNVEVNKFVSEVSRQTQDIIGPDGTVTGSAVISLVVIERTGRYLPCYTDTYDTWSVIADADLFYDMTDSSGDDPNDENTDRVYGRVGENSTYQRIKNATITYISNQYIKTDSNGKWEYDGVVDDNHPEKGIFANQNNVKNLIVSPQFKGIGDYAFYNSGITTIKLENGLQCIGNHAFDSCRSLASIDIDLNSNLTEIGAYAFKDCQTLMKFVLPNGVIQIDDGAFEGCMAITEIDLCSGANVNALQRLGRGVFKDCSSLQSLTFPNNCDDKVYMSSFKGCNSLKWISTRNRNIEFPDGDDSFTYNDFKNQVTSEFYFEGLGDYTTDKTPFSESTNWDSKVHELAWRECFPFSYLIYVGSNPETDQTGRYEKQDHYELTVLEGSSTEKNTFVVNSNGELEKHVSTDGVSELEIPNKIGPYTVVTINGGVFENSCNIEKVTIPETVKTINANAFKGCHNLKSVIFNSGDLFIDSNAFKTQDVSGSHRQGCNGVVETDEDNSPTNKLSFIGPISASSAPFQYAMSSEGRYNATSQKESYITYYSGWPTNLKVEYDPNAVNPNTNTKGMSVLTDFPSLYDLQAGVKGTSDYFYVTGPQVDEAQKAAELYKENGSTTGMTENQIEVINGALNLVIPEGIQLIAPGLVKEKEDENILFAASSSANVPITMTITAFSLAAVEAGEVAKRNADGTAIAIEGGTFAGCEYLAGVTLNADTSNSPVIIEDYAFEGCKRLSNVSMADVASLGKVPFFGCESLSYVNFQNSSDYVCDSEKSIIYGLDENGNANTVIECLPGRASNLREVTATELGSGITTIAPEAFRGSHVRSVDLSSTNITSIPEGAFANTDNLQTVTFPETLTLIGNYAFAGSTVDSFYVRGKNTGCSPFAFYGESNEESTNRYGAAGLQEYPSDVRWYYVKDGVTSQATGSAQGFSVEETEFPTAYYVIYTYRGEDGAFTDVTLEERVSSADEAKLSYPEIPQRVTLNGMTYSFTDWEYVLENGDTWHFTAQYDFALHVITFMDSKNGLKEVYKMEIADGGNALRRARDVEELAAIMDDVSFVSWDCEGNLEEVTGDYTAVARYRTEGEYIVRFYVRNGSISSPYELHYTTTVKAGENAPSITIPAVTDYVFTEWDKPLSNIQEDTDFYARYAPASGDGNDSNNGDGNGTNDPNGSGDGNGSGSNGTGDGSGNSSNGNGSSNDVARHTLQVRGGSGSGYYAAGEQIIITADEPAKGQEFSSWTVSPEATVATDKTMSSFILTMPNNDVAVIANYKAKTSSSSNTGSGNSPSTNATRPNGTTGTTGTAGGTTVVIDKNGLSNTGVVSATVNGSSDSFTIKVTDSISATESILKALQAEYGSLDNIKYFPMDISLYDATGTTKITDTTGLSVSITLPLPDSLITYAGNNMVAGVVNDKLDKLTPRFTTINGVACVTFTAEHFSPYVIYVDVTNLSDGTISDSTPKTGDGIHPKWFLSIGLACLSFVMFMVKDSKGDSRKRQKVAVRARN